MTRRDMSICKQVATESVAIASDNLGKDINSKDFFSLADIFTSWIINNGDSKETLIQRQAALRRSVMAIKGRNLKNTKDILEFAEELYKYF